MSTSLQTCEERDPKSLYKKVSLRRSGGVLDLDTNSFSAAITMQHRTYPSCRSCLREEVIFHP